MRDMGFSHSPRFRTLVGLVCACLVLARAALQRASAQGGQPLYPGLNIDDGEGPAFRAQALSCLTALSAAGGETADIVRGVQGAQNCIVVTRAGPGRLGLPLPQSIEERLQLEAAPPPLVRPPTGPQACRR